MEGRNDQLNKEQTEGMGLERLRLQTRQNENRRDVTGTSSTTPRQRIIYNQFNWMFVRFIIVT